jgi:hypothetical protein
MEIETKIDESKRLTTHFLSGKVYANNITGILKRFFEENPTENVLWDFRETDPDRNVTIKEIEEIARLVSSGQKNIGQGKTAIVASSDLVFGLARTYEFLAEIKGVKNPVKVFRSREKAEKWFEVE